MSDLPPPGDGPAAFVTGPARESAVGPVAAGNHGARIVVADDNADMREYVVRLLGEGWRVEAVADGASALEAIGREQPDLVISDVMMPALDGFELLRALRQHPRTRTLPVILLSARAGEESRIEALAAGADDFLVKPFAARELVARVEGLLALARVRREAELAIRESEERYRAFIELTTDAVWRIEMAEPVPTSLPVDEQIDLFYRDVQLAECNDAMAHMYGYGGAAELLGARLGDLLPRERSRQRGVSARVRHLAATASPMPRATRSTATGRPRYFVEQPVRCRAGRARWCARGAVQRDVTERRQTHDRLQQAQRMESVGKLAGGIAHEVNNMMSVVLGCSDFLLRRQDLSPAAREDVEHVREAAERSAAITAQLLAFSRRQCSSRCPSTSTPSCGISRRCSGARSATTSRWSSAWPRSAPIRADRGQLQQVLLNLALNARDAMPGGGRVVIETSSRSSWARPTRTPHPEIRMRHGPYALLDVHRHRARHEPRDGRACVRAVLHDQGGRAAAPASGCPRCTAS